MRDKSSAGALPLFIGGGDRNAVRGCRTPNLLFKKIKPILMKIISNLVKIISNVI